MIALLTRLIFLIAECVVGGIILRYIRLMFTYIKFSIKSVAAYRGAFVLNFISQFISYGVEFALMWIMVNSFDSMNGWTKYEVMLLFAMSLASYSLAGFFFFSSTSFVRNGVKNGAFDDVMLKPVYILPFLICSNFNLGYVSHMTLSIIMIIVCLINLNINIGFFNLLYLVISIIAGAFIYGALFLLCSTPTFFKTKLNSLMKFVFFLRQMSFYPLSIFSKSFQFILSFIIPYGMINFYPIQAVIKKEDFLMFDSYMQFVPPFFSVLLFTISVVYFNFGVKHYNSTGS